MKSNEQGKSKYIRAPIRIDVPYMEDMQSRKNPFNRSSQPKTLEPKRSGTLIGCRTSSEKRVHVKSFIVPQIYSCPTFLIAQRHDTLISDVTDSISEEDCEWALDERVEPNNRGSYEELKTEKYGRYEMTREIQHNFSIMRFLDRPTLEEVKKREVELEPLGIKNNKVLALDLDETLMHTINPRFEFSNTNVCYRAAQTVLFKDPESQTLNSVKVIIRPYALRLLEELSQLYEIVVNLKITLDIYSKPKMVCGCNFKPIRSR